MLKISELKDSSRAASRALGFESVHLYIVECHSLGSQYLITTTHACFIGSLCVKSDQGIQWIVCIGACRIAIRVNIIKLGIRNGHSRSSQQYHGLSALITVYGLNRLQCRRGE